MNNIDSLYTTINDGRTHIAADKSYVGNVNSYNNWFTKFFAWVFRLSMTVNFDGKIRSVNKKSYLKLVSNLLGQDVKMKNICQYCMFRGVVEKGCIESPEIRMRDKISSRKSTHLFHKLAYAISQGEADDALRMIGKGAALDIEYYHREKQPPAFKSDVDGLDSTSSYKFRVCKGTPIIVAVWKTNLIDVVNRLKEFGADMTVSGQQYLFEGKVVQAQNPRKNSANLTLTIQKV